MRYRIKQVSLVQWFLYLPKELQLQLTIIFLPLLPQSFVLKLDSKADMDGRRKHRVPPEYTHLRAEVHPDLINITLRHRALPYYWMAILSESLSQG